MFEAKKLIVERLRNVTSTYQIPVPNALTVQVDFRRFDFSGFATIRPSGICRGKMKMRHRRKFGGALSSMFGAGSGGFLVSCGLGLGVMSSGEQ